MSIIVLSFLAVVVALLLPPLFSGFAGKSLKFTLYYAAAVAAITGFSRLAHYYQNGLGPGQSGAPPLPDYALSLVVTTLLGFVLIFALSVGMYLLGRLVRHGSKKRHTSPVAHE
jgi:hypothetical protein